MKTLAQDLRHALRSLFRDRGFTAVAGLTLAIGVGANTAIFSVLNAVVLRDLPYHDADRLALLWTQNLRQNLRDGVSYLNFRDWKEQSREFEDMAVYRRPEFTRGTLAVGQDRERIHVLLAGPGFFRVLATPALLGRTLEPADVDSANRVVVISHGLWQQRFGGDAAIIGRSIEIEGGQWEVVGVMPAAFQFPTPQIQVWAPIWLLPQWARIQHDPRSRGGDPLVAFGRLKSTATIGSARAELDTIAARLREAYPDSNAGKGVLIEPLLHHVVGQRTVRALWLLFGAVAFVLLIVCTNVANLWLARGAVRRSEFSVRIALGASRARLIWHALAENVVLAALAAGVGALLASLGVAALRRWAGGAVPRLETVKLDLNVLLFALAISLACGLLAGLLPALLLSAMDPAEALRDAGQRSLGGRGSRRLRRGLVIAELALAVILLSGAGLMIRSFVRVQAADRGFESRNVLLLQVDLPGAYDGPLKRMDYFRQALERIRALPGVAAAGAVTDFFIQRQPDARIALEGQPPRQRDDPAPPLTQDQVFPGYFEAMRIPLLRGRLLQEGDLDAGAPPVVVINEEMARRFWPGEDPVGKRLTGGLDPGTNAPWTTVVGVVADMKRQKLDDAAIPCMFRPGVGSQMDIAVRTLGDPAALQKEIRAALLAFDPAAPPYGIVTAEQRLGETIAVRTLQTLLLGALAAAALILAVIGVYGILQQSVVTRTPEIGIRMALGASKRSVLWMVLSGALGLAGAGLGLGMIGALALGRTVSSFLYETSAVDPLIHAGVAALLLVVTSVACLGPALRAAGIDPMAALRYE